MTDEGVRRNAGSWAPALCLALLAACGPDATVTGTGAGSGGATVHTVKIVLAGNGSVSSNGASPGGAERAPEPAPA